LDDLKLEVMYFYSEVYENKKNLSKICTKISKSKDIQIRLVNIDDPVNENLTEIFDVNMVPMIIFFTPKGDVAAKKFVPLSEESLVQRIVDQINKGDLPNPLVEETKIRILDTIKSISRRNDLTETIAEQIETDLTESSNYSEIYKLANYYISTINHTISDLQEFKKALKKYQRKSEKYSI
jgi:thioredoxin-like negative regulator of GroEL